MQQIESRSETRPAPGGMTILWTRLAGSGFALAVIANVIWGTSFLASKYTVQFWGPFTASAYRFGVAILGMLLVMPRLGWAISAPKNKSSWLKIAWIGISGFGLLYPLQLGGLVWIPSSLSAAIMLTSPLFVILISATVLGAPLSTRKLLAIGLGMAGGCLLISPANLSSIVWSSDTVSQLIRGSLFTIGASLSLAVSVLATRSATGDLDSRSITFWSMCIGEAILIPFALFEHRPTVVAVEWPVAWSALFFLAIVCSVFAFLIWNRAIATTSPQNLASTMHIKTPIAVVLGTLILGEPLTPTIVIGTLIVSFALWLSQSTPSKVAVAKAVV